MLIIRKKYVIIRGGDNGCPREKLKVQSNDRFGIVWVVINRQETFALFAPTFAKELLSFCRQTEFVIVVFFFFRISEFSFIHAVLA